MITKHVVVLPYDEKWKRDFIAIKDELTEALGDMAITIEHVGSTSVEDYECNQYMDEWNYENWGIKYWSKTPEFIHYVKEHE